MQIYYLQEPITAKKILFETEKKVKVFIMASLLVEEAFMECTCAICSGADKYKWSEAKTISEVIMQHIIFKAQNDFNDDEEKFRVAAKAPLPRTHIHIFEEEWETASQLASAQLELMAEDIRDQLEKKMLSTLYDFSLLKEVKKNNNGKWVNKDEKIVHRHLVIKGRGTIGTDSLTWKSCNVKKYPSSKPRSYLTNYICALYHNDTCVGLGICIRNNKKETTLKVDNKTKKDINAINLNDGLIIYPLARVTMEKATFETLAKLGSCQMTRNLKRLAGNKNLNASKQEGLVKEEEIHNFLLKNNINHFNTEQKKAIALFECTTEGTCIIQGPPGTGKSYLLACGIIPQIINNHEKVLVLCNSNKGLDSILQKLVNIPQNPYQNQILRFGYSREQVPEVHRKYYIDKKNFKSRIDQHKNEGLVVFSTLHQAKKNQDWCFDTIVIDEAGVVLDAAVVAALVQAGEAVKKLVLIGDHKQLPPIVKSQHIETIRSCMERQLNAFEKQKTENDITHIMLCEQWRMAPLIRQVVSKLSYDNLLRDSTTATESGPLDGTLLHRKPVLIINIENGKEYFDSVELNSYSNYVESRVVENVLKVFLKHGPELIGCKLDPVDKDDPDDDAYSWSVITPYHGQRRKLATAIVPCHEDYVTTYQNKSTTRSKLDLSISETRRLDAINTVHAFQGAEQDVIFFSAVRDGSKRKSVHTKQQKQLINVALSRAKHMLVIIGSIEMLASASNGVQEEDRHWKHIYDFVQENSVVLNVTVEENMTDNALESNIWEKLLNNNNRNNKKRLSPMKESKKNSRQKMQQ